MAGHSSYFACRFQVRVEKSSTRPSFVFRKRYGRHFADFEATTRHLQLFLERLEYHPRSAYEVPKTAVRWRGVNGTELRSNRYITEVRGSTPYSQVRLQRSSEDWSFPIISSSNPVPLQIEFPTSVTIAAQASNTSHSFLCSRNKLTCCIHVLSAKLLILNGTTSSFETETAPFVLIELDKFRSTLLRSRLPWCSIDLFCPRQQDGLSAVTLSAKW